ncbi:SMC domain protein [Thermodesulfobium narugense DSM 14796]|uniref:DNA repair protein RecN n=1 Tax=Thermodesulfobium narugense DSM 14796 TaxID=747365 RepID=M1E640_9BACT|nr:AAA family ATPase [Thermodesulfobium narugense]AEE14626.1 SMC domain protein [Thermodesulfobium narugense DSM 14796]
MQNEILNPNFTSGIIKKLIIDNAIIIDNIKIELSSKINALTGETGAGKSLITGAIASFLGEKIVFTPKKTESPSTITLEITGFYKNESDEIKQDDIKITKITNQNGKSTFYVNDKISNLKTIKSILEFVEVTGQHSNQSVLKKSYQNEIFDSFSNTTSLRKLYQKAFENYKALSEKLYKINSNLDELKNRKEILQDLLKIIEKENFYPGEISELIQEKDSLKQYELINEGLQKILEIVSYPSSFSDYMSSISIEIKKLSKYEEIDDLLNSFINFKSSYENFCEQVEAKIQKMPDFTNRLMYIQDRLSSAEKIRRILKLQEISQIEAAKNNIESEINKILDLEREKELLEIELENSKKEILKLSGEISKKRAENIETFSYMVENQLKDLDIPNARFMAIFSEPFSEIKIDNKSFSKYGAEEVEFYFSANPEMPLETLNKVASGGELSRIVIALELLKNEKDKNCKTFIFDEIDAGIGGFAAVKLREKLIELSKYNQILIITHQANIAACADLHFKIIKDQKNNITRVFVKKLHRDERLEELSRMLSGNVSEYGLKHAKELLK